MDTGPMLDSHWESIRAALSSGEESASGENVAGNKRSALERLPQSSDESSENTESMEIFQCLVAEDLADTQAKLQERQRRLAEEAQKRRELREQLDNQGQKRKELKQQLDNQSAMVRELRQRLNQQSQTLKEEREKTRRLASDKERSQQTWEDVDRLVYWIESLERDVSGLQSSWPRRIWTGLGKLGLSGLPEPKGWERANRVDETFEQFRTWLRERRR